MTEQNEQVHETVESKDRAAETSSTETSDQALTEAEASSDANEPKLVPVSEAVRYRKRAQTAERELEQLQQEQSRLQNDLQISRETIEYLERRQRVDQSLQQAEAIDLETARLLTEIAIADLDEPDIELAVEELKREKPFLFRRGTRSHNMSARPQAVPTEVSTAAEQAKATGHRRDLLHYLRLRRQA